MYCTSFLEVLWRGYPFTPQIASLPETSPKWLALNSLWIFLLLSNHIFSTRTSRVPATYLFTRPYLHKIIHEVGQHVFLWGGEIIKPSIIKIATVKISFIIPILGTRKMSRDISEFLEWQVCLLPKVFLLTFMGWASGWARNVQLVVQSKKCESGRDRWHGYQGHRQCPTVSVYTWLISLI